MCNDSLLIIISFPFTGSLCLKWRTKKGELFENTAYSILRNPQIASKSDWPALESDISCISRSQDAEILQNHITVFYIMIHTSSFSKLLRKPKHHWEAGRFLCSNCWPKIMKPPWVFLTAIVSSQLCWPHLHYSIHLNHSPLCFRSEASGCIQCFVDSIMVICQPLLFSLGHTETSSKLYTIQLYYLLYLLERIQ